MREEDEDKAIEAFAKVFLDHLHKQVADLVGEAYTQGLCYGKYEGDHGSMELGEWCLKKLTPPESGGESE